MKKLVMFLMIGLGFITFNTLSFADSHMAGTQQVRTIEGTVDAINTNNNTIILRDKDITGYYVLSLSQEQMNSLTKGATVTVTVKCWGPENSKVITIK